MSDISENSYGGGGGGGGGRFRGGGGDAGTMIAATIASGILKVRGANYREKQFRFCCFSAYFFFYVGLRAVLLLYYTERKKRFALRRFRGAVV